MTLTSIYLASLIFFHYLNHPCNRRYNHFLKLKIYYGSLIFFNRLNHLWNEKYSHFLKQKIFDLVIVYELSS